MEQTRIILAIALSALVFLAYNYFFPPVPEKTSETVPAAQTGTSGVSESQGGTKGSPSVAALATELAKPSAVSSGPARSLSIETPLYRATFSENGAVLTSFVLKQYRKTADANSAPLEMVDPAVVKNTLAVFLQGTEEDDLRQGQYTADSTGDRIDIAAGGNRTLVFEKTTPSGIVVQKRFSFNGDSYLFNLDISVKNNGSGVVKGPLALALKKDFPAKSGSYGFEGPNALVNGSLQEIKIEDIAKQGRLDGQIEWIGLQDRYFNTSLIPLTVNQGASSLRYDNVGYAEHTLLHQIADIQPGGVSEASFKVYFGPKSLKVMSSVGHNLGKAVDFGFFDILAKPLLWFMNFIYSLIPNYGVAIILLTLLTKIVLWPLGSKSYRSMSQMKKIQPLMLQIREKYKDDKKRMNEETMALYRLYKVNPMGGCLPMVVQIPVFFALYRMLYETIELRHAPFFGWINDLSAPDRLFDFGVAIPFMDPPYGIPVLTIVMGATMFIQQKMSPPMGDPAQAKMMLLMPIVFTVIFINFSSGLVLYWLINNVFSIAQQYYTQKNA